MATKEKKQPKKREVKEQVQVEHAGKDLPVPPPRLRIYYEKTVRDRLKSQFGFTNVHQIPTLEKIVINCSVGEAIKNLNGLDTSITELGIITGQRPVRKKAKKSIANFGLRQGQEIGAELQHRGTRVWQFIVRSVSVGLPRILAFIVYTTRSLYGRGIINFDDT